MMPEDILLVFGGGGGVQGARLNMLVFCGLK
jgi:hypothetical protein